MNARMLPTKCVCNRWVDELLQDHENVIGVYNVGTIDSKTLTDALEDVLLTGRLKIHNCRGQCYDDVANMSGSKTGVQSYLLQREPWALFTHCYGHSLNLAVGDALKNNKVCRELGFEHDDTEITDNLSRILQSSSMPAADEQEVAELTVRTLQGRDKVFHLVF